jgi:hypothetical protein
MTSDSITTKPFSIRMREYFGYRPGQGANEFAAELKALSHEDKVEFAEMLNSAGFPCAPPITAQLAA